MVFFQNITGYTNRKIYAPERKRFAAIMDVSNPDLNKIKRSKNITPNICY